MDSSVISVKLDAFDGPLDLLLHLIEKNKIVKDKLWTKTYLLFLTFRSCRSRSNIWRSSHKWIARTWML